MHTHILTHTHIHPHIYTHMHTHIHAGVSSWCHVKSDGLQKRSKRVRPPVALFRSLSNKYSRERDDSPYPPSYWLNSTTTVLQEGWIWHWITRQGWYAIKQSNQTHKYVHMHMCMHTHAYTRRYTYKHSRLHWCTHTHKLKYTLIFTECE